MSLEVGTQLGHYQIHSKLGEGGMGEVYLAVDTKLGRKVGLKILPGELASNQDRMRRFTQEAKAAAALNHPNIAHIYEIGEQDGTSFIAMEYVDGYTLRQPWDGAPPTQITNFNSEVIRYFSYSHDGKHLAMARGNITRDAVLITEEK